MAKTMNLGVLAVLGLGALFLMQRGKAQALPGGGEGAAGALPDEGGLLPDVGPMTGREILPRVPGDPGALISPYTGIVVVPANGIGNDTALVPAEVAAPPIVTLMPVVIPPMKESITRPTESLSADALRRMDQQNDAMSLARDAGFDNLKAQYVAMQVQAMSAVAYQAWRAKFILDHFTPAPAIAIMPTIIEPLGVTDITAMPAQWLPGSWQYDYIYGLDEKD